MAIEEATNTQIAALKSALLAKQAVLTSQEKDSANWRKPVELDQQSVGRLSRMDAMQQQAMSEAEAQRRKSDLLRIEAALLRIEEGEYGYCDGCGEAIAFKRLEIDPMATRCVGCAK